MIVKLCAPGVFPDPGTLDVSVMQMPRKGDTLVIHTGPDDVEQLVVKRVVWTFEAPADRSTLYHDVPELVCDRAEDVGDTEHAVPQCKYCTLDIYTNDGGDTWWHDHTGLQCCYDVYKPEIATPTERTLTHGR